MAKTSYTPPGGWPAYQKKRRQAHQASGLCIYCKMESLPGKVWCEFHKKYQTDYKKEWRLRRSDKEKE